MLKFTADFIPQAWVNAYAYAVDPEGDTSWDCTAYVTANFSPDLIERIVGGDVGWYEDFDTLRDDPAAPEWVRDWSGPFEVQLTVEG